MEKVIFWGSSDDLIEVDGKIEGCDEYNDASDNETKSYFIIKSKEGKCKIIPIYDNEGCWCFAVSLFEEDEKLPDWKYQLKTCTENGYCVQLEIEVPNDAKIKWSKTND